MPRKTIDRFKPAHSRNIGLLLAPDRVVRPRVLGRRLAALALVVAAFSVGANGARGQETPAVPTIVPERRSLVEYDEYTGRFEAINRVEVRARVSGFLDRVAFQEGQIVQAGDLLFVIDQRPFRIAVDAARADYEGAVARRDLAKLEKERAERLLAGRTIPREQYDEVHAEYVAATARVSNRKAALAHAELELEYTEVAAPISGRIGKRRVDEGNLISGGTAAATLLTTIVQEDPIYFVFDVSETDYLRYSRLDLSGARPTSRTTPNAVSVKLLDEQDFVHHGVMDFVDNELDASSGTLQGRAVLANPGGFIQPGVFGRLRLQGSGLYEAVLVPDEVIQFDQSRLFVFVIDESGRVDRRWIEPGPIHGDKRIVRSGLSGHETIIAGAFHRVRVGAEVESAATALQASR
ncbi:MAG: efflux RND transporter periplasmic adaptor subunit [bacterium]|nr:efflux RND transporter periplasmic adaptor subunit [bacterium]